MTESILTENRQKVEDHITDLRERLDGVLVDDLRDLIMNVVILSYDYGCLDGLRSCKLSMTGDDSTNEDS